MTFVVLKSAGLGNRIKLYVSYMQRYEELLIEKEPDLQLFENFELCDENNSKCIIDLKPIVIKKYRKYIFLNNQ